MKSQNTLGLIALTLSMLLTAIMVRNVYEIKKESKVIKAVEHTDTYDYVQKNVHDIVHQSVSTTYHDYIVVIDSGKVVGNGVIHVANCKCKN